MMVTLDDIDLSRPSSDYGFPSAIATRSNIPNISASSQLNRTVDVTNHVRKSYLSSMSKRPRRNVKKRYIVEASHKSLREDAERLLDNHTLSEATADHDQYRAPKVGLCLFLFVCSIGGYQGVSDYLNARNLVNKSDLTSSLRQTIFDTSSNSSDNVENTLSLLDSVIAVKKSTSPIEGIPQELDNMANVLHEHFDSRRNKLYLWHIPRSGSTTIKRIAANCMGLTLASEAGKSELETRGTENALKIVEGSDGMRFANVDLSHPDGIKRAIELNVGSDPRIDLISSAYLYQTANVFDSDHKGYMLAIFRHPIDRAVSLYYNMRRYPQYAEVIGPIETLEMYTRSSLVENNWMTRFLSNTLAGQLRQEHEALAREVLRTKCIILLLRDKTESIRRLEIFFNATVKRTQRRDECTEKLLYWDWPGKNRHDQLVEGSDTWHKLYEQNSVDIRLYEYAEQLFVEQAKIFKTMT